MLTRGDDLQLGILAAPLQAEHLPGMPVTLNTCLCVLMHFTAQLEQTRHGPFLGSSFHVSKSVYSLGW